MDTALRQVWTAFVDDDGLDVAVWTGTGTAFCAGADRNTWFDQWLGATPASVQHNARGMGVGGLTRGLPAHGKPVIAAVNGTSLVGLGLHHGDGGISRLLATCGLGVTLDLELSGEPMGLLHGQVKMSPIRASVPMMQ